MFKHLHKTKADPRKKVGTSEPYEGSDRQRRVRESTQRHEKRKEESAKKGTENPNVDWDKLRKDLKSEFGSEEQMQAAEEFGAHLKGANGFSIQRQAFRLAQEKVHPQPIPGSEQLLGQAERFIKREGKNKTPDSVIAIFDLVVALNNYKGNSKKEISLGTDLARLAATGGLAKAVRSYLMDKDEKKFVESCNQIMTQFYKPLAADVSLWNAIKEFIKPALEYLHIDTKRLLSSNNLIKDKNVQGMFKKVVQQGIEIAEEEQIDTNLNKP
ncbi:TPA: hypothetical protein ACPHYZ_003756 [Legionella anisa]